MAHGEKAQGNDAAGHHATPPSRRTRSRGRRPVVAARTKPQARMPEVAIDPVCGMKVKRATAKHRFDYQGRNISSVARGAANVSRPSRTNFSSRRSPTARANEPARRSRRGAIYTCPMDPEVRQVGPGTCPICGMALEPEQVSLDQGPDPELIDMTRRFWVALALTVPVFAIEMGRHLGLMHVMPPVWSNWVSLALSTPVVLWAGAPFFVRGWRSVVSGHLNMFTLIAMGTGVAWIYSVIGTLVPQPFPPAFRDTHGAVAVYFEAAAVITVLVLLGQVLELRARERTSGAIRALLGLAPKTARRITGRRRRGCRDRGHRGRRSSCGFVPAKKFRSMAVVTEGQSVRR